MAIFPQFLAILVCMILLISVLGSDRVPWWRVGFFLLIALFGLWAASGAYSILGPAPAFDVSGNMIKDPKGHPLYRAADVASAEVFTQSTAFLSFGCLITGLILGFVKLCSGCLRFCKVIQPKK
jgi:hypothetical protein